MDHTQQSITLMTDLSYGYRECCHYQQKCGNLPKAIRYAKEELEIERYCMCEESSFVGSVGAQHWLRRLEHEGASETGGNSITIGTAAESIELVQDPESDEECSSLESNDC